MMNRDYKNRYGKRVLAKGVEVSNDTRVTGCNNNDIVVGKSGCGKTGGYVIPNIQNIDGSLVVSDTKGLLERRFKKELEAKGYEVYTLDFVNPKRSCGYSPMRFISRYEDGSYREQDILTLAKLLCPSLDAKEPIWDMSAASYIAFLIGFCLETEPEEKQNLIHLAKLHREFCRPNGDYRFAYWVQENGDSFAAKKYYELKANQSADRMWASIMGFVNANLEVFGFAEAKYIFAEKETFDLANLGKKKTVLFLNTSDTDRAFDRMINIFHTQVLQILCSQADQNEDGRLDIPVRMILDDFAAGSTIPDFDKVISVIRSRDIYVSLIIQSISQLEGMYDKAKSLTIINNCDHLLFLGSHDPETAQFIGSRACKTPETILGMARDKAYLISPGQKASLVDKIIPYSTVDDYAPASAEEDGVFQK